MGKRRYSRRPQGGFLFKVLEATKLVKSGKVYRLGHISEHGIPINWFHGSFEYFAFRRQKDTVGKDGNSGGMNVRIEMADHTGTHIDALNHVKIGDKVYVVYRQNK